MENNPDYSQQDYADFVNMYGHALGQTFPQQDPNNLAQAMLAARGIDPQSASLHFQQINGGNSAGAASSHQIFVDPDQSNDAIRATLGHEIEHMVEARQGLSVPAGTTGPSDSNTLPHFAGDLPGQQFPYEGKNAVQLMINRLNDPDASGLIGPQERDSKISDILTKRQRIYQDAQ